MKADSTVLLIIFSTDTGSTKSGNVMLQGVQRNCSLQNSRFGNDILGSMAI